MTRKTNLRALRHRYGIPLSELSAVSGLSCQYISRAELGESTPTALMEEKLSAAMEAVIVQRSLHLTSLERSFAACKGRLLQREEGKTDE